MLKPPYFGHRCEEPTHWKRPWCWERLKGKRTGAADNKDKMVRRHHWFSGHEFEQSTKYNKLDKVKDRAAHGVTKSRTVLSDWTTTAKKFVCLIHVCIWKPRIPWNYLDWCQIRVVEGGIHVRDVLFGHFAEIILKRFFFYRQKNIRLESRSKNIRLEKYIRQVWRSGLKELCDQIIDLRCLAWGSPFFRKAP